jgi:hypothetical protein
MFPAEKRVSFRTPLEEEITTVKYTLAHSDIESSVSTLSSAASSTSAESDSSAMHHSLGHDTSKASESPVQSPPDTASAGFSTLEGSPRLKQPRTGEKRDSSSSEDESDTCPETPVAGRRKRTRDWRWTLGPLPGPGKGALSTTSEDSS